MILGFKTGPKNFPEGQQIVTDLGASMCELWFNVNKHEEYKEMIAWLQKNNVSIGLHYWGVVDGGKLRGAQLDSARIKPNLATQNEHVQSETIRQIQQTIDIGNSIGCAYVNIHPGAQALETIDFSNWEQRMTEDPLTPAAMAQDLLLAAAKELHEYADAKHVLLTIESLPAVEKIRDDLSDNPYNPGNVSVAVNELLGNHGTWIANDVTHSGSQFLVSEPTREAAWNKMMDFSTRIQSRTRLVHVNTITRPFNGTDSHDGITDEDFQKETFPTKEGVIEFLHLFKDRNDVYVVPEPKENPAGNYEALRELARDL